MENYKPEHNARITLQKINLLIKTWKLKKGPLRGIPHNLSKVSLEVKELEITGRHTAASKNNPESDQARSKPIPEEISQQSLRLQIKISKKDLIYPGKELDSLKNAIYSFTLDVIANPKEE